MPTNYERDLLIALRGPFRATVDYWQALHNKWSFHLGMLKKSPVVRVVFSIDNRPKKWFEKPDLEEAAELIHLLETRFKLTSRRWIREGEIEYKLWIRYGEYDRQKKEREETEKRVGHYFPR